MAKKKLYFYEVKLFLEDKEIEFCRIKNVFAGGFRKT